MIYPLKAIRAGWMVLLLTTCFIFILSDPGAAQTVSGVPGYVRVPAATFNEDATLYFGSSFLPRKYLPYTHNNYDALAIYCSVTFLSFVEIDLRVTRILGLPEGSNHVVDRVPTIRFRILKERRWIPAVTIGLHDVITSLESGEARHFGASYLVVTKNFHIPKWYFNIEATAGYGLNGFIWKNNELMGPFGALALRCVKAPWLSLLFDWDGETPNTGLRVVCFKHLNIMAGFLNFSSFTGSISYQFNLKK
jgi:hypothetical protein